jgi:hypothetical protein
VDAGALNPAPDKRRPARQPLPENGEAWTGRVREFIKTNLRIHQDEFVDSSRRIRGLIKTSSQTCQDGTGLVEQRRCAPHGMNWIATALRAS